MKKIALFFALLLAFSGSLSAQVSVDVLMDQPQFIPGEPLPVKVRISNNSGQVIHLGDEAWISYAIECKDGPIVLKNGEAPIAHNIDINPAQWVSVKADLAPYFVLNKPGRYTVKATVYIKKWNMKVSSSEKFFDLLDGTRLWEQAFGVPQSPTNTNPPEVRKYILQQVTLDRDMKLYFRLTDATESRSYKVFAVGQMISFSDPQTRVDSASNLHLLYQSGSRAYSYLVFNPAGEIILRQSYAYVTSAPHLQVDQAGNAVIVGGVRRLAENDLPATRKSIATNELPPPVH